MMYRRKQNRKNEKPTGFFGGLWLAAIVAVFLIGGPIIDSYAQRNGLIASISGNDNITFMRSAPSQGPGHYHGYIIDNGAKYATIEEACTDTTSGRCYPDLNARHLRLETLVRLHSNECYRNGNCLKFTGFNAPIPRPGNPPTTCPVDSTGKSICGNDREEIVLEEADAPSTLHFGETRYESFWIYFANVDNDPSPRSSFAVINQFWQADAKTGLRPPLGIGMSNKDRNYVHLNFSYHDDPTLNKGAVTLIGIDLKKGQWHRIDMKVTPSHPGLPIGGALIWVDRKSTILKESEAVNYSPVNKRAYRFYWGYTPDANALNKFRVSVGMYRTNPLFKTLFWMQDIKLGDTAASIER